MAGLGELGEVAAVSPLYETAPIGGPDQGPYLNAVVILVTGREPRALLEGLLAIEQRMGRERRERWGPRTLDLDLLLYDRRMIDEPGLSVPHPRLTERRFVLQPLVDADPDAALPDGRRLTGWLEAVSGQEMALTAGPGWWQEPDPDRLLETPLPEVTAEQAEAAAAEWFGVAGNATPLAGERDRNFAIDSPDGGCVLKIANPASDPAVLDLGQAALEHVAAADPGLGVARVVRSRSGRRVAEIRVGGSVFPAALQTRVPGDRLPDGHSTPGSRAALGRLLARLDVALAGLRHPALVRTDPWDLARLPELRPRLVHLDPGRREVIGEVIDRFEAETGPRLAGLRRQPVHTDANPANLLTAPGEPDRITGIVDFSDVMEAPLVTEVAVAAAYQCMSLQDPAAVIAGLLASYRRHLPLDDDEVAAVPGLVAARIAQSLTISAWRADRHPGNRDYVLIHAEPLWGALRLLWGVRGSGAGR